MMIDGEDPVDVECHFIVDETGGVKRWRGTLSFASIWMRAGRGRLYLPGGHSGSILVTAVRPSAGRATFIGHGDPPAH
jgi:hypothetical protein